MTASDPRVPPTDDGTPSADEVTADRPGATPGPPDGPGSLDAPRSGADGPTRPGLGTFTIEGRQAPALFVVGWLATIMGLCLIVVVLLGGSGAPAVVLLLVGLVLLAAGLVAGAGSQALERRGRDAAGYRGPSPFLAFAAVIPLTVLLQIVVFVPLQALGVEPVSPLGTLIALLIQAIVYVGLIRLLVVGTGALSWVDMGVRWPGRLGVAELAYGAMLGVPLLFVTGILAALLSQVLAVPEGPLPEASSALGALLNLVSAAIVAPVAEEIFFRGYATTAWWRSIGPSSAIVRGGLLFAAAHVLTVGGDSFGEGLERAAFAFLVRLPVAFALGWVFVRRRSLLAAIGLHAAYNGVPVVLILLGAR